MMALVRDFLAFLLDTFGYEVKTYDSGLRFLEGFTGEERGCVLTDVRMPGLTGLELALRLKSLGSQLPIVVLTGHADVALAVEAMKAGVDDFIEKPFDDHIIINSVEHALERDTAHPGAAQVGEAEQAETMHRLGSLSARERQVLQGVVSGKANKEVARGNWASARVRLKSTAPM